MKGLLVTGGGDSVGRAIAELFSANGWAVHIADVRTDAVEATLAANPGMTGTIADVSNAAQVDALFEEAGEHLPSMSALVNCVGVGGPRGTLDELSLADWQETFRINVDGLFMSMRRAIPLMRHAGGGTIVNFSSGSTRTRLPRRTAYIASKYAVEGMTLNAAREFGADGIRCNAILPGIIDNARMRGIMAARAAEEGRDVGEIEADYLRYISMRTLVGPAEIAETVAWLCSDAAKHVTGELIAVSGNLEWEA